MEKEARETMDENESCAAISEDVPLPFSPSSVLRSVEETPDLSSLLQTPKKEDETPNTTQTPGTSSIQVNISCTMITTLHRAWHELG